MKNSGDFTPALIVKLILVLVFLLTAAFVSGVVIGKNGRRNVDRTSLDEEGVNEKLSNCIFNSDELRGKYLKLRDVAREKGLVDENDLINTKLVCSAEVSKSADDEIEGSFEEKVPAEKVAEVASKKEEKPAEKVAETAPKKEEKPVEKVAETAPKKEEKPVEKVAEVTPKKEKNTEQPKAAENKTISEILIEKGEIPKKNDEKKCHFSIQIASLDTLEQVAAAKKQFGTLSLRVVTIESNGKKMFKIRTGCFDSREVAESELPKVRKLKKDAFIVSE